MVGDDPRADIVAARRVGLRGVLVLTGKTSLAKGREAGIGPEAIAADLREVVAALP
jgi:ribonucleotide monophosphatase NagD (HAD superfamily)